MRKKTAGILFVTLTAALAFPQVVHDVSVVNITVPVRVYDGDRFVDSLKLEDFEVYEDGRPQQVQAVYLVRGAGIQRREGPLKSISPVTRRHFVLLFLMTEYLPEIDAAVNTFFDEVLRSGDTVDLVTPRKNYRLTGSIASEDGLRRAKREVGSKVRQDLLVDSGEYAGIIQNMIDDLGGGADPEYAGVNLQSYATNLQRLAALRTIDPERLTAFANELKGRPGAKHVFLFFQKERVPQFSNRALAKFLSSARSDTVLQVMELMSEVQRQVPIDRDAILKIFADASLDVHFLYVTRTRRDFAHDVERPSVLEDVTMGEHAGDIYSAFREIAAATGGTADASANPSALLRKAAQASEQYYLLYYRPQPYTADGKFHEIKIKIRQGGYRVTHRAGYVATDSLRSAESERPAEPSPQQPVPEPTRGALPEVEVISPEEAGAPAPAQSLLQSAAAYCRRLQSAALHFVCREEVRERLSRSLLSQAGILKDTSPFDRGLVAVDEKVRFQDWTYDYQLIRREGRAEETRVLLEKNGRAKREENARLATSRFEHSNVILGPVGLLGEEAQRIHAYRVVKELDVDGEPVAVLDARPVGEGPTSLFGKAWVRIRDGAVLKIEWAPASMGNYTEIARFAKKIGAIPKITFSSEYAFEKNGLRFPSAYGVTEDYQGSGKIFHLSKTNVAYKDYKFFQVKTEVRFK
jgi:VWFA-related protein